MAWQRVVGRFDARGQHQRIEIDVAELPGLRSRAVDSEAFRHRRARERRPGYGCVVVASPGGPIVTIRCHSAAPTREAGDKVVEEGSLVREDLD